MATITRGKKDRKVLAIRDALNAYEAKFPGSSASLYRANPGVIRARIIDDRTAKMTKSRRHSVAWDFLESQVGQDLMSEVYQLIVLPSSELQTSMANLDFEDPIPSML